MDLILNFQGGLSLGFEFMRTSPFYKEEEESDEVSSVFSCPFGVTCNT